VAWDPFHLVIRTRAKQCIFRESKTIHLGIAIAIDKVDDLETTFLWLWWMDLSLVRSGYSSINKTT
jgi:hypothetical protein